MTTKIAAIGAGPATLFLLNEFIMHPRTDAALHIFESKNEIAVGMPYSNEGADDEHICNLSCEETPDLVQPVAVWLASAPEDLLQRFNIDRDNINVQAPVPRLLFGEYLKDQFDTLLAMAKERGLEVHVHLNARVKDLTDFARYGKVRIDLEDERQIFFDQAVIATGHVWPKVKEGKIAGYYDSPYPPKKLSHIFNQQVGLRGASLTAVDAVKTLAKMHGEYVRDEQGDLTYLPHDGTDDFKVVMHSRQGILPCPRMHFDHPQVTPDLYVKQDDINEHRNLNNGKVTLDFIFDKGFKQPLAKSDPDFHAVIKDMSVEEFVGFIVAERKSAQPFLAFENELKLSKVSVETRQTIHWKETIGFLNAAVSFSAKHMSAEDILRVRQTLMPLVASVIAYLPHDSSDELIALHKAGKLELLAVGPDSQLSTRAGRSGAGVSYVTAEGERREIHYDTFIDCVGQRQMSFGEFPFKGLVSGGAVAPAQIGFASAQGAKRARDAGHDVVQSGNKHYLALPGIAINDNYQLIDETGRANPRIFIMAVPQIGGLNPDFSGLDFCELSARKIIKELNEPVPISYQPMPLNLAVA